MTSRKSGPLRRASEFFYAKSTLVTALIATAAFVGYTLLVLSGQGKAFEVANSTIKSLGTSLGFGQAEILAFFAERSTQQISAYITFNQVWDSLYGVICHLVRFSLIGWRTLAYPASRASTLPMARSPRRPLS
jgi:hypothetical protein